MAKQAKKVAGVYERIEGSGLWHVQYRNPKLPGQTQGKLIRKAVGTRQQAIEYLNKVRHIRASGSGELPDTATRAVLTYAEAEASAQSITLRELCDGLLVHIKANPSQYKDQLNPPVRIQRIKEHFGSRPAMSVRPSEISAWLASLDVKAPSTRNRYKSVISAVFQFGKERDLVTVNPARDVKQLKVNNGVIRFLTPAEETRLRKVLQDDVDACGLRNHQLKKRMLHRIYELDVSLGTGMRKGEQYSLVWPDVHFDRKELIARDTKNGADRRVLMIDDVVKALKAIQALELTRKQRSADKPNLSHPDSVFAIGDNGTWWDSALERAKIRNYRWHDNRHTFCSRLAQSGASLKVIQEAAGHKTISMAARYSHLDQSTLRSAMEVLNRK